MLLNRLLDSADLISFSAFEAHNKASRHRHNPQPTWQDARYTANDSFHLARVDELTVNAILELFDHLGKVENSNIFVDKELAQSFGHPGVLLELSLLCLALEVLLVALASLIFQPLFRLN